jgi:hypothetical protein
VQTPQGYHFSTRDQEQGSALPQFSVDRATLNSIVSGEAGQVADVKRMLVDSLAFCETTESLARPFYR